MTRKTSIPGITQLDERKFRIRARVVDPRTGKRKEVDRVIENVTLHEATRTKATLVGEIRRGEASPTERVRLRDYATSWLASRTLRLKRSTARTYADCLDGAILPRLGDYYLDALTHQDIDAWMVERATEFRPATVNKSLRLLKTILADAAAELGLPRNAAVRVRSLPKLTADDDEPNSLAPEELSKLLVATREKEPEWYPLVFTLALTGLRFGEASALKWSDLDETRGLIRVVRSQWFGHVATTKTGRGRTVPLVPELKAVLDEHRRKLVATQTKGLDEGWVFPSEASGDPETSGRAPLHWVSALRKPLRAALKFAGIKARFTPHGFRRTFNNLARQIAGEIVTRAMTGHVTPSMTEHYSHVGAEEKHAAVGRIVQLVVPTSPAKVGVKVGDQPNTEKAAGEAAFQDNGTTSVSGAGDGDRTRDPRLGNAPKRLGA